MPDRPREAVFTQIDAPGREPGLRWVAELVDAGWNPCTVPYAVAWLTDFTGAPVPMGVILDFVMVPDHYRRRGFATELVAACEARWPDLTLTEPISAAGEGLAESLCPAP